MNIDELTKQEKSVMLAKAMGGFDINKDGTMYLHDPIWEELGMSGNMVSSFYAPANMALAKKAIEWGATENQHFRVWLQGSAAYQILVWDDGITHALDNLLRWQSKPG